MNFNRWLADLPSVNFKTAVSYGLAVVCALTALVAIVCGRPLDIDALAALFAFIGALAGLGHMSYATKRATWRSDAAPAAPTTTPENTP